MNTLIIGASGELGKSLSHFLNSKGYKLILHGFKGDSKIKNLAAELNTDSFFLGDISNEIGAKSIIQQANEIAPINSVVYAAGINPSASRISDTDVNTWNKTISVNLTGAFLTLKYSLPILRERENSSIVIVSSVFGISAPANRGAYSASKHGLIGLVQSAAKEEAGKVRINAVCPGPMWSENVRHIFSKHAKEVDISVEDYIKDRQRQIPYGRFLEMEECSSLIQFLLSDESKFITGEAIRISGGEF